MSPPSPEQVDAALAALTGTVSETRPESDLDRNLVRLRLVAEATSRGVPWSRIGAVMGLSGKACKARMKHLARETQRELLVRQNG